MSSNPEYRPRNSWRETYRDFGVDLDFFSNGEEPEPYRNEVQEAVRNHEMKQLYEGCRKAVRLFDIADELWILQVNGEVPELKARGVRDGTPYIDAELVEDDTTVHQHPFDILEKNMFGVNKGEYFSGNTNEEPEHLPISLEYFGEFSEDGPAQGHFILPGAEHFYGYSRYKSCVSFPD